LDFKKLTIRKLEISHHAKRHPTSELNIPLCHPAYGIARTGSGPGTVRQHRRQHRQRRKIAVRFALDAAIGRTGTTRQTASGKIIGEGLAGYVSPSGAASSVRHYNGITVNSSGHVSGRSGSGTFRRSDGCTGRWTSTKQNKSLPVC
jgi:hypothetical protein